MVIWAHSASFALVKRKLSSAKRRWFMTGAFWHIEMPWSRLAFSFFAMSADRPFAHIRGTSKEKMGHPGGGLSSDRDAL